jgi:hypothetical protein
VNGSWMRDGGDGGMAGERAAASLPVARLACTRSARNHDAPLRACHEISARHCTQCLPASLPRREIPTMGSPGPWLLSIPAGPFFPLDPNHLQFAHYIACLRACLRAFMLGVRHARQIVLSCQWPTLFSQPQATRLIPFVPLGVVCESRGCVRPRSLSLSLFVNFFLVH